MWLCFMYHNGFYCANYCDRSSVDRGVDYLNSRDWAKACTLVTRTSVRNVPVTSYQTAFTEVSQG